MDITTKIREKYKEYQSCDNSDSDVQIIIDNNEECCQCGKSIYDLIYFPSIRGVELYCEYCERERFYSTCPICEDYYENPEKPTDEYLIISKEAVEEHNISVKPGFYQVLKYPYFYGDCVGGFDDVFTDSLKLIREIDIHSMLYKINPRVGKEKIGADSCCYDCMLTYTGQTKLKNNYGDKDYGKIHIALMKKVIKAGK